MIDRFYVYQWTRPDTGVVFYIGKGSFVRDIQTKKHNAIVTRIVAKLEKIGMKPEVARIRDGLTEDEAFEVERLEIAKHGRINNGTGTLANMTDGGEGTTGVVRSALTRARLSASLKGNQNSFGRVVQAETRAKIGLTKIGNQYFLGKKHSKEARSKIADGARGNKNMLGRERSAETCAKLSAALTGKKLSVETRLKISAANIGKTISAETRSKISAANLGVAKPLFSDEHKQKLSFAKRMAPPKSGLKGVCFFTRRSKWRASITIGGASIWLGDFSSEVDAAKAYDVAAIQNYGTGNCYLNFPLEEAAC